MSFRQRILAAAGAMVLFGATLASAMSQNAAESNISVTIVGDGPLMVSVSASPSTAIAMNEQTSCTSFENLSVNVLDKRGQANGWTVFMSVQPASGPSELKTLTFWPRVVTVRAGNPDLAGHSVIETITESARIAPLWSTANHFGDGSYALGISSTSTSPCDSTQGIQTLTMSIRSAGP